MARWFIPAINAPMLCLNYERLDDKNLRLPKQEYQERLGRRRERLEALVDLVENDSECRCIQMYRYFGQENERPCGCCDVCLAQKRGR